MPLAFATLISAPPQALAQLVVYDNTLNGTPWRRLYAGSDEVGDQIILDLTGVDPAAKLKEFSFQYYQVNGADEEGSGANAQITFYANDGSGGSPSTILWQSSTFHIDGSVRAMVVFDAAELDTFVLPLPTTLTWSVKFSDLTGTERAGVDIYTPPTVGNNFTDYWRNSGSGWSLLEISGLDVSFAAHLEVVPEPSEFAVALGLGALAFGVFRRRKAA